MVRRQSNWSALAAFHEIFAPAAGATVYKDFCLCRWGKCGEISIQGRFESFQQLLSRLRSSIFFAQDQSLLDFEGFCCYAVGVSFLWRCRRGGVVATTVGWCEFLRDRISRVWGRGEACMGVVCEVRIGSQLQRYDATPLFRATYKEYAQ